MVGQNNMNPQLTGGAQGSLQNLSPNLSTSFPQSSQAQGGQPVPNMSFFAQTLSDEFKNFVNGAQGNVMQPATQNSNPNSIPSGLQQALDAVNRLYGRNVGSAIQGAGRDGYQSSGANLPQFLPVHNQSKQNISPEQTAQTQQTTRNGNFDTTVAGPAGFTNSY